jgi:CubicO group peptidase (beta-lactamase class C family)
MRCMRRALLWILAIACFVLVPTRADARPGRDRIVRLRAAIAEVLRREGVPGVGLALVDREGVIWAGGVGTADLEGVRPVGDDTLFRVASITKSFVALGVARLHEQGRLDLDAPVARLLPDVEMRNRWADQAPVTLAHLLEHTAGFDDMHLDEHWGEGGEQMSLADVLARNPRSRTSRWRPGTRFSYANPGYTVAAAAIERITGERYQDVLRREVFGPLGIEDAHLGVNDAIAGRLSDGHIAPDKTTLYTSIYHHPAGALITSPSELAKLVHHWLVRSDAVVGPEMLARIERSGTVPFDPRAIDYGLGNYGDVVHPSPCRGHDGGLPGYISTYRYCPDAGVGYVMLLNGTHSRRAYVEIRRLLFDALTEDQFFRPPPPRYPTDEELDRATGFYGFANPRHEIVGFIERLVTGFEIVREGDHLVMRPLVGDPVPLVPTADGGFRLPGESGTTIRFTQDRGGDDVLVVHWMYLERGSAWLARLELRAVRAAMQIMLTSALGLFLWLVLLLPARRYFPESIDPRDAILCAWPGLASLAFYGFIAIVQAVPIETLMTRNAVTMTLCALTIAFPFFTGIGMAASLRALDLRDLSARSIWPAAALLASSTCFGITIWLLLNGVIGLRTWSY